MQSAMADQRQSRRCPGLRHRSHAQRGPPPRRLPSHARRSELLAPGDNLVVDNGSSDNSRKSSRDSTLRWVPLDRNFRLRPSPDQGHQGLPWSSPTVREQRHEVRPRLRLEPRYSHPQDDSVFATDARQLDWDGDAELHGATQLRRRALRPSISIARGSLPLLDVVHKPSLEVRECFQACGGNMAVDRAKLELLGGLDDRLVAGWEDADLAWRSWARGWRTLFIPERHVRASGRRHLGLR